MNTLNKFKILKNIPADRLKLSLFDSIDSTNAECKRMVLEKDIHVIISNKQTDGKGRVGKTWSSPDSGNIYMSIACKGLIQKAPLSLIVGIICQRSIEKVIGSDLIGLKWPNDIIYSKKKIGGILIEKEIMGQDILNIIGIGLNLNLPNKESWWGDLSSFNLELKRNELINIIIIELINFIDNDIHQWVDEWEGLCIHMNSEINIKQNNKIIDSGIFTGINQDGSVKITSKDGNIKKYEFGEISIDGVY
ncbi:biotin--[acetyl-CoA-carboxylase] ligase [Gammaproteobacteria bacterium]|nr:biotin--[acetyl-CoA-carboxylase] ligase [Gammaproteobacteria bacterium]MDA8955661.1 biotin--[acetyl-CoA-carboxylase] ligase [Gammaproteobacteria bacterium]MDA9101991.1 biotin--[acetyl-CoA-carboxylase] ligase [Gammaproteobacteria bacterium]